MMRCHKNKKVRRRCKHCYQSRAALVGSVQVANEFKNQMEQLKSLHARINHVIESINHKIFIIWTSAHINQIHPDIHHISSHAQTVTGNTRINPD
ncbi:Hypothetical protein CINCED_3A022119 [Cinara cedri]|uniref:Uncharacterized protein n=1 Tax=Cinara cedri TaxID=506608 RepID=A0A5E4M920_9HEMI|nr:Hypothetical protein CINCED_3A022119 [Cinara cedri]